MKFSWFALLLIVSIVAYVIGMVLHSPDRLRQPSFWLTLGLAVATLAFLLQALDPGAVGP